jgi:hypothetical protein
MFSIFHPLLSPVKIIPAPGVGRRRKANFGSAPPPLPKNPHLAARSCAYLHLSARSLRQFVLSVAFVTTPSLRHPAANLPGHWPLAIGHYFSLIRPGATHPLRNQPIADTAPRSRRREEADAFRAQRATREALFALCQRTFAAPSRGAKRFTRPHDLTPHCTCQKIFTQCVTSQNVVCRDGPLARLHRLPPDRGCVRRGPAAAAPHLHRARVWSLTRSFATVSKDSESMSILSHPNQTLSNPKGIVSFSTGLAHSAYPG